jgi:hypothetical protein
MDKEEKKTRKELQELADSKKTAEIIMKYV